MLAPLPDAARLWLFAADRSLSSEERAALLGRLRAFTEGWASHGRPVPAVAEVLNERVLAVGAVIDPQEVNAGVSGCGIDALQHALDAAAEAGGFAWCAPLVVHYRDSDGALQAVGRPAFRRLAREGAVTARTPVLDLTPETVGMLRECGVERPAGEAWHGRVFGLAASEAAAA